MKVKETTKPVLRTFNIELNETELRILTVLLGYSAPSYFKEAYRNGCDFNEAVNENDIHEEYCNHSSEMYSLFHNVLQSKD